jgi:hypothetical protein
MDGLWFGEVGGVDQAVVAAFEVRMILVTRNQ